LGHVLSLLKDIRAHACFSASISDPPIAKVDTAFLAQTIDGLQRSATIQTDPVRGLFSTSVLYKKWRACPLLSRAHEYCCPLRAALLTVGESTDSPPKQAAFAAFVTNSHPDFRSSTDDCVPDPVPYSALMARFDYRLRSDRDRFDPPSEASDHRDFCLPIALCPAKILVVTTSPNLVPRARMTVTMFLAISLAKPLALIIIMTPVPLMIAIPLPWLTSRSRYYYQPTA
jgi:hypothetical protein